MSKTWIWQKARRGEIPSFKIGKYYFFKTDLVDSWIERHRQSAKSFGAKGEA